ncbi:fructosamine kinase family protein [Kineosporia sp. A_224]|uniref:fructosamine kinase family protein n=1 Tax=Kineosporia sp. A_224 TaxID=1962180 RepID=UPI000B4C14C2|nr:fructosamine kinase family protein [Kineosporia sp. A_224]
MPHPLLTPDAVAAVERAVSAHRGRAWRVTRFTDLDARASHPAGLLAGDGLTVFAKLHTGPDAAAATDREVAALALLTTRAGVRTPVAVGTGGVAVPGGHVLVQEAVAVRDDRLESDWRAVGGLLAALHAVRGEAFGATDPAGYDGSFGPLPMSSRPVASGRWCDFLVERRWLPFLRAGVDAGRFDASDPFVGAVERLAARLPELAGPDVPPALLHGDAQQNNLLSTPDGAVAVDPAPYFGHPEADLAAVDVFEPVGPGLLAGYRDAGGVLDPGFPARRDLWLVGHQLAVVAVDGGSAWGRQFHDRLAETLARCR